MNTHISPIIDPLVLIGENCDERIGCAVKSSACDVNVCKCIKGYAANELNNYCDNELKTTGKYHLIL